MKVVITGGAGFLGKKLARRILQHGSLAGPGSDQEGGTPQKVTELLLFDVAKAAGPGLDDPRVKAVAGDIANVATVQSIVQGASTVFHFAAVVSAGAEADFDLGYRVNLDGTRNVLEACRGLGTNPRVVFTLLARGLWRRPAQGGDRRYAAYAADLLRRPEIDRRIPDPRLHAQGLSPRHRGEAADDLRAHRPAQQGGLDLGELGRARRTFDRHRRRLPGDAADDHGGAEPAQDGRRLREAARPAGRRLRAGAARFC